MKSLLTRPRGARLLLAVAAALVPVLSASAQLQAAAAPTEERAPAGEAASVAQRLVSIAREDCRVQDHLRYLCRAIGPRLTGSSNLERAQEWALERFEQLGLEAHLETWGEVPVGFDRGPSSGRIVSPEPRALRFVTMAWTAGTDGPLRGRALLEPESEEELERVHDRLAGAWLLRREGRSGGFRERRAIVDACREAGIAGVLRGSRGELLVTSGNHRVDPEDLPTMPEAIVLKEDYEALVEQVESGAEVVIELDLRHSFRPGPIEQYNVVADLVGSEWPDQYVIVQAHLDSWDGAEGACDNGTGVATTLEAARLLVAADARPRRTVRFVLYSGEEQGLYGSKGYVRDHEEEMARTSIVLNHDNGTGHVRGIGATEAMRADFERVFAPAAALDPERPFTIRPVDGLRPGPSDHAPFVRAGVPAFHWDQDTSDYQRVHHTQHDLFEAAVPEEQEHSAIVIALAAHGFAQLDHLVDRTAMIPPEPRRMGVQLTRDGSRLRMIYEGGRAEGAGWQVDDEIVSIDGEAVDGRDAIVSALQKGGPVKTFVMRRGEDTYESVLDWSDDPDEPARAARRAEREEAAQGEGDDGEGADTP